MSDLEWNGQFFEPKRKSQSPFDLNLFCLLLVVVILAVFVYRF